MVTVPNSERRAAALVLPLGSTRKQERKRARQQFAPYLSQEAPGLGLSDIARANRQKKAQHKRGHNIQHPHDRDTRKRQSYIRPAHLSIDPRSIESIAQTCGCQRHVAHYERESKQL